MVLKPDNPDSIAQLLWWFKLGLRVEIRDLVKRDRWIPMVPALTLGWATHLRLGIHRDNAKREFRLAPPDA